MKHIQTLALVAGLLVGMAAPEARQANPPPPPAAPRAAQPPQVPQQPTVRLALPDERDARETRERLRTLLRQYPPSVQQVLRIDTSLLSRPDYLATYPALAAFLEQHPEVAHNPAYFVGETPLELEVRTSPASEAGRTIRDITSSGMVVLVVMTITGGLVLLIRSLVEQRRWQRASPILLADEPTGNLDSKSGEAVMQLLSELHKAGATICMVTHDPRYARHASRAIHLFDGKVVDEATARQAIES